MHRYSSLTAGNETMTMAEDVVDNAACMQLCRILSNCPNRKMSFLTHAAILRVQAGLLWNGNFLGRPVSTNPKASAAQVLRIISEPVIDLMQPYMRMFCSKFFGHVGFSCEGHCP